MKQQVKTGVLAGTMMVLLVGQTSANLIANSSFEGGNGTWNVNIGTGTANVDTNWVGRWSNGGSIAGRMLLTDASEAPYSLTGQTGSKSLLSRGEVDVSQIQIIDVGSLGDISNKDWSLSVDVAAIGTVDYARFALFGFNELWDGDSGAQVDLVTQTTPNVFQNGSGTLIAQRNAMNFGLTNSYKTISLSQANGAILEDYNYLAVVLTAEVAVKNDDAHAVAWDNVSLTVIPEPATIGLVALFGGSVLFIRRRFTI